jgi:hypothetical protein
MERFNEPYFSNDISWVPSGPVRHGSSDTKLPDIRRDSFAGHFADKVQLVIGRRPEITVP